MTTSACARCQASVTRCTETPSSSATAANSGAAASSEPAAETPPNGDHGSQASPSAAQCASSSADERQPGENWFCTLTSASPSTSRAASICGTDAFEMPTIRTRPSSCSAFIPAIDSSHGVAGSGRWNW